MFMTKIWERYFLREIINTFLFFILCFYGLYILIDYASHTASFHHNHVDFQWKEVATYYACDFVKRLDFILPFALLIASIRTFSSLNTHNELIALMSSGISLQTLMRPFIFLGLFCTCLLYFNTEYLTPVALQELRHIHDSRDSKRRKYDAQASVQHLILEDNSTIVFQNYDSSQNRFFDAYWIQDTDNIYRMKYLFPYLETEDTYPVGHFVDHLTRNAQGELVSIESFATKVFPTIHFNKNILFETITTAEEQALSELWKKLPSSQISNEKEAKILATFYQKLLLPWLCLFAIIGPAPFCLRTTRNLPTFFIYAGGIFSLLAFDVVQQATVILGERQVLPSFWIICLPFVSVASILIFRFVRLGRVC